MNLHERRRLGALRKRRDWLKARVLIAEGQGRNLSFDKRELGALEWAIETLGGMSDGDAAEGRKEQPDAQ